jgi:hypothetical protein
MSRSAIVSAVNQAWDDAGTDLPTAFEGRGFTKPAQAPWAQLWLMPVSSDQSLQTVDKEKYILQVDLNYPPNLGTQALTDMADQLKAYFAPRSRFSSHGQSFWVESRTLGRVRDNVSGWQYCNLSVTFNAVVDRS